MVEKSSALLNHYQEQTQMKVDGDHSQIAKLKPGQGGAYPNVLRVIKDGLQSASEQYVAVVRKEADVAVVRKEADVAVVRKEADVAVVLLPDKVPSTTAGDDEDDRTLVGYQDFLYLAKQAEQAERYEG
jgi:hypothetical protein